jgi:prepilin-type N-terminal cleavage/methylation domain-containing protein
MARELYWKSAHGLYSGEDAMKEQNKFNAMDQKGFSLIELLVVMGVVLILTTVSLFYLTAQRKLYNTDEQALKIIDLIQEARQRALTQRETLRVEIDLTSNTGRLINENNTGNATDDKVLRQVTFYPVGNVRSDIRPTNVSTAPPETLPVPTAQFVGSQHPLSAGHNVATFRFLLDGTVVNAGTNATGSGATVTGATLYIWKPKASNNNESEMTKAITILGATGSVRMWDFAKAADGSWYWKDSRRAGYGSSGSGSPVR